MQFEVFATEEQIRITAMVADKETAQAIAGTFPKFCKVHGGDLSGNPESKGYISMYATIKADGVNGGWNETGIKRVRKVLAQIEANGDTLNFREFGNSISEKGVREIIG